MFPFILNQKLQGWRARLEESIKNLHQLSLETAHEELQVTVSNLRNRLNEPFMFVIVGEVKAGKSSFVNALLEAKTDICKVAPQPMTDTIQQILFGEKEETIEVNPFLKKIFANEPILQEIAIVDTPGTNTIVAHHQEITESFIPASDLIVFVFEAKNPYRQSAWEFFDFIHKEWRKKVIFVLQQKDLMEPEDLVVNLQGVVDHADKKGVESPAVFAVSAKMEKAGQSENSGFLPLRQYIKDNITGGQAPLLKLQNNTALGLNILERIHKGIQDRQEQLEADIIFREDIKMTLQHQDQQSRKQVDLLVENLLGGYDRITLAKQTELEDGLGFVSLIKRSFSALFDKSNSPKEWLDRLGKDLENDLNKEMNNKLQNHVNDLAESIQQMAKMVELKIANSRTILKNDHEFFSEIAEKRSHVLRDLQDAVQSFMQRSDSFTDSALFPDTKALTPNLMTGGGLAVVGTILMAVTNGMVFDITGGVLTGVGLLFAGVTTTLKRRSITQAFEGEIQKGRSKLATELDEKLKAYVEHIRVRLEHNFRKFDDHLANERKQIDHLSQQHEGVHKQLFQLETELQNH